MKLNFTRKEDDIAEWLESERTVDRFSLGFGFDIVISEIMHVYGVSREQARVGFAKWVLFVEGKIDYD